MSIIVKALSQKIEQQQEELSFLFEALQEHRTNKNKVDNEFAALVNGPRPELGKNDLKKSKKSLKLKAKKEAAQAVWDAYQAEQAIPNDVKRASTAFFAVQSEVIAKQKRLAQLQAELKATIAAIEEQKAEMLKAQEEAISAKAKAKAEKASLERAAKINAALAKAAAYKSVVAPVIEGLVPRMIVKYTRLAKAFDSSVELIEEGGAVATIGEEQMKEFMITYELFVKDILQLKFVIAENQNGPHPELKSKAIKSVLREFETLSANVEKLFAYFNDKAMKYADVDFMLADLYGAACPSNIFNLLVDNTGVDAFIDKRSKQKETVRTNILDRIKLCWKAGVDCFFDEGLIEGKKYDAIKGVKKSALAKVDVAFDGNLYQSLKEKVDKIDLTTSMDIIQQAQKAKIAGNVYRPIPTLTFEEGVAEPYINSTYGVRSIVEKYAQNMLLKVDKKGEVDGMGWIGDTTAAYMNYSLLMSAGGGRVFMNKAAMISFAAISNSLVDVKAYIASVAGSSCVEEKQVTSAIGVKLWIYVDENGKPIVGKDGRIRGKKNSNEGSSWNNWGGRLPFQERTVANEWIKFIQEVNKVQAQFSLDFRNKVRALKEGIRIDLAIRGCFKNPNVNFGGKYSKLNDVVGIQFVENISSKDSCNGKAFSLAHLTVHTTTEGAKYVQLPMIGSAEATRLLVDKAPQVQFISQIETAINVKPVQGGARWALTFFGLLVQSVDRCHAEGIDFDWVQRFKTGSDPMVTAHVKKFSSTIDWNWKSISLSRSIFDKHYSAAINSFATIVNDGKTIVDLRREMEDAVVWPVFQGLKSLWGFVPSVTKSVLDEIEFVKENRTNPNWEAEKTELLKAFPKLTAVRLEQAVELESFDPTIWSNTLATAIIGKGKSLPVDIHRAFVPWNNKVSVTNLEGEVSDEEMIEWLKVSFVKNKDDGACKSASYKSFLKKVGEAELAKVFDLDDEKSAEPGQRMISIGYMFGKPMDVTVAVMRRMKLGKVGATFQATEKKPTSLHGSGLAGEATEESTISFKEYWGILPCGGTMSRTELPQIPGKLREDFLQSLNVDYEDVIAKPKDLQPLQEFVSEANSKSKKPLLISIDGFIIDGHHRWYANQDNESISCVIVHMEKDELLEKAKAFDGVYYAQPTRFELAKEYFELVAKLPMTTEDGSKLSEFQRELDPYDLLLPGKLYLNMMEALCRVESAEVFKRINENIATSLDGELLKVYQAMGCTINDSAKLTTKQIDSINAKLSEFVRGAVIKAVNIPVHVFDAIEEGVIILPPRLRTKTHSGNLALAFRYPIASATSVGIVRVLFGDDPAVKDLLHSYGIDFSQYPDVVFMSAGDKTNYQFDDDGDTFGILFEPAFNLKDWKLSIARTLNEFEGKFSKKAVREDGTINKRKYSKKLWTTVKSWVGIGMNLLQRGDYDSQNIEMPDIKTDNNKKSMQIMDLRGYCTEEFRKLSHKDARGPVGLISDLFTVILASSAQGEEFTRLACVCGYILQHSIDSAKKEKLVIPAAILLNPIVWLEVEGKLELRPEVNAIILEWNEAYAEMDRAKILKLEAKANTMFKKDGNFVSWLPTMQTIEGNCKLDDQVLFFAPSTLLANMSEFAKKGCYGTFDFFGTPVPVHPKLADASDPSRYIAAHTLEIHQFTDADGKIVPWKAFSAFRKINVKAYAHFESKFQHDGLDEKGKAKWSNWIEWSERTDLNNFPAYFSEVFVGNEWESYPNLVFKNVLRWAVELCWNGKDKLQKYSQAFNEDNRVKREDFVAPKFPWTIAKSRILVPEANKTVVQMINGEYSYTVDERFAKELSAFFVENVVYYKGESKKKWSVELLKMIQPWIEEPMTLSSVIESDKFDKESFYINYTRLMRQVGLLEIAAPQYKEVAADHYAYLRSLNKNSSEFKQLTQWSIGDTLYNWNPNPITQRLVSIVNARYKDVITKNGRNPEDTWMPSFRNYTKSKNFKGKVLNNYQLKPSWYIGSDSDWIDEMKANVTDVVVGSLTRHVKIYACELTEPLIEDLKKVEDLHLHIKDESKQLNPFTQILIQHNTKHFNIIGTSYTECECCQSNIRKLITSVAREHRFEVGSQEHLEYTAKNANVYVAQQLIGAVKAQSELLVEEAIESNNFNFEGNRFGLKTETIFDYVEAFGSDLAKAKFGLPLQSDYLLFEEWDSAWSMLNANFKSLFIQLIEKEVDTKWWNAPIGYLVHNLEAFMVSKKMIKPKGENTKQWMSLTEWNKDDDDDPTDPSPKSKEAESAENAFGSAKADASASASVGNSSKSYNYTLLAEGGCTEGETSLEEVAFASLEIQRLKKAGTFVKGSLDQAQLVIIWATKNNSEFIQNSLQKVGKRSVIVLNKPEHVQKLVAWTKTL